MTALSIETSPEWTDLEYDDSKVTVDHKADVSAEGLVLDITFDIRGATEDGRELFHIRVTYHLEFARTPRGLVSDVLTDIGLDSTASQMQTVSRISKSLALEYSSTYGNAIVGPRLRGLLRALADEMQVARIPYVPWERSPLRYVEILDGIRSAVDQELGDNGSGSQTKAQTKPAAKRSPPKKRSAKKTTQGKSASR
jgi:hypothetical protein